MRLLTPFNVQRSMVRRNVGIPAEKQIVFRIGINVGISSLTATIFLVTRKISRSPGNALRAWRRMYLKNGK